jgi:hypothetical protein
MNTLQINCIKARAAYKQVEHLHRDDTRKFEAKFIKAEAEDALLEWAMNRCSVTAELINHPDCLPRHREDAIETILRTDFK